MRMLFGTVVALAVLALMLSITLDFSIMKFRHLDVQQFGTVLLIGVIGMFLFLWITGKNDLWRRSPLPRP